MTIHDGYNRIAKIQLGERSFNIIYRPALAHERKELFRRASVENREVTLAVFRQEIQSRVLNIEIAEGADNEVLGLVFNAVMGVYPKSTEKEDAENLQRGVTLYAKHPHLPFMSCQRCREFMIDPLTGKTAMRGTTPQPRDPEERVLCDTAEGCPKGHYSSPITFSEKNRDALRHYLECRATGNFPDDAIVRQNAKIISHAMLNAKSRRTIQFQI